MPLCEVQEETEPPGLKSRCYSTATHYAKMWQGQGALSGDFLFVCEHHAGGLRELGAEVHPLPAHLVGA